MSSTPLPHPLDFDWRYDDSTAHQVADLLSEARKILSLGVPSVARISEAEGRDVTLVDRQPIQGVRNHVVCAIEEFSSKPIYDAAIIDPPWYPKQIDAWTRIAGQAVVLGGHILLSLWPEQTRPEASTQLEHLVGSLSTWSKVERNVSRLSYLEPSFETIARHVGSEQPLSKSPLVGELIRLKVERHPEPIPINAQCTAWHRFILDDYQLAIRNGGPSSQFGISQLPQAKGWLWPFVSARADGIEEISIWSSLGEVGSVGNPLATLTALRKAVRCTEASAFDLALAAAPELLEWQLPRPPYGRMIEWQHLQ